MGEIGINRREYLYELTYCDIICIERGYYRRHRGMWSAVRWQTYNLMCVSMADMKKAGIHNPTDLLLFPWERKQHNAPDISEEEIAAMQEMMRAMNAEKQEKEELSK